MQDEKFEYESIQDNETVGNYLESFVKGFRRGKINLKTDENTIELEPNNLLQFTVKSEKKGNESRIAIKVSWSDADKGKGSDGVMEIE